MQWFAKHFKPHICPSFTFMFGVVIIPLFQSSNKNMFCLDLLLFFFPTLAIIALFSVLPHCLCVYVALTAQFSPASCSPAKLVSTAEYPAVWIKVHVFFFTWVPPTCPACFLSMTISNWKQCKDKIRNVETIDVIVNVIYTVYCLQGKSTLALKIHLKSWDKGNKRVEKLCNVKNKQTNTWLNISKETEIISNRLLK